MKKNKGRYDMEKIINIQGLNGEEVWRELYNKELNTNILILIAFKGGL